MKEDYKSLFNGELPSEGNLRERVEKRLNTDYYRSFVTRIPEPKPVISDYDNPPVKLYKDSHKWDNGWYPVDNTQILSKCPAYLPTVEAIDTLTSRPIIEIGAGDGCWAHVLNTNGGDVIPTDILPKDIDTAEIPSDYWQHTDTARYNYAVNDKRKTQTYPFDTNQGRVWTKVHQANHTCITEHSERDILLCHPPVDKWVEDVLEITEDQDQTIIFIGEWGPSQDATGPFFQRLDSDWKLTDTFPIIDWRSMSAHGYIFTQE